MNPLRAARYGLLIVFSLAGGAGWAAELGPAVAVASEGRQPQVGIDEKGQIHIVYGVGNTIRITTSSDLGKTFSPPTTVGSVPALSLGMRRGPRIAATSKAIVVTAAGGKEGKGRDGDILAWRSTDGGLSWSGPTRVNAVESSAREGLHGMAAGPDGALFVAWLDLRNQRMEIFGARSLDGGATWQPDLLIYRSPDHAVCPCCHPSVAYGPDGMLHVMWRNQLYGFRDMYMVRSTDGGKSFGKAEKLGRGTWSFNACPMDGGALIVDASGRVETVWMRENAIFSAVPGKPEARLGRGVQVWGAEGPDGPYAVWLEKRPGALLGLLPGDRRPHTLAENANDPVVASAPGANGPVVAAWEIGMGTGGIAARVLAPGVPRTKTARTGQAK